MLRVTAIMLSQRMRRVVRLREMRIVGFFATGTGRYSRTSFNAFLFSELLRFWAILSAVGALPRSRSFPIGSSVSLATFFANGLNLTFAFSHLSFAQSLNAPCPLMRLLRLAYLRVLQHALLHNRPPGPQPLLFTRRLFPCPFCRRRGRYFPLLEAISD